MGDFLGGLMALIFMIGMAGAWITSIAACVYQDLFWLLLAVIFLPPIGVVHGVGVWIGIW